MPAVLLLSFGGYLKITRQPQEGLPENAVTVTNAAGTSVQFSVEMAVTPDEREKGLMFRPTLAAKTGMAFIFPRPEIVDFWMKNTIVPLDMIFVRRDGMIASIARDRVPFSLAGTFSGSPVTAVLEMPAGTAARFDLARGDRVSGLGSHLPPM
ncbi:MAG: DUF192 domain-containing protein [Rhodospirillales bacterium]|nr:DUF192 domain-containing protein [Rhodospirillales bacterium]